jgi:hypothetical protein
MEWTGMAIATNSSGNFDASGLADASKPDNKTQSKTITFELATGQGGIHGCKA